MSSAPAADRVLAVLSLLARHPEPVPAGFVATRLGLPRSTAYRLLSILVDADYVSYQPEDRRYGLGLASYELGSAYERQAPLQRMARTIVRHLVDRTRQNAHLSVLHGRDVLYLIEERAVRGPMLLTDVGVRLPAPRTASGLAMLAALPAAQVRAIFPDAAAFVADGPGPTTPTALRRALADVRNRGYAFEDGTVTAGLASVAQPVRDHTGHPSAAIAATYRAEDLESTAVGALVRAITDAAAQLSHRLGHHA